jgi:hypothetical protein
MISQLTLIILLIIIISLILNLAKKNLILAPTIFVIVTQFIISFTIFKSFGLIADEILYHEKAILLMESLNSGYGYQNFDVAPGKGFFTDLLGTIYFMMGDPNPLSGLLLNALVMGFIPSIMVISCKNFGLSKISTIVAWIFALTPSLIFWPAGLRREALAFLLVSISILAISLLYRSKFFLSAILLFIAYLFAQDIRNQIIIMMISGFIAVLFLRYFKKISKVLPKGKDNQGILYLIIISQILFLWSIFRNEYLGYGTYILEVSRSETTAAPFVSWSFNSSLLGLPYNIFRVLFGPLLWEWNSVSMFAFGLEGLFYFIIVVVVVYSIISFKAYRTQFLILLVFSLPLIFLSALVLGNYGLNSRIRAHYLIPLLPIVAVFISNMPINFLNVMVKKFKTRLNLFLNKVRFYN